MISERVEEYLAAIYRLRSDAETPVPLSQLRTFFGFSAVSIHEMIQKLEKAGWITYRKYRGVYLTETGEDVARAVLRRHRLWEHFLSDALQIPRQDAHQIAHRLEHAAPEEVTERLAKFLKEPVCCPLDGPLPPGTNIAGERNLAYVAPGESVAISNVAPLTPGRIQRMKQWNLQVGVHTLVVAQTSDGTRILIDDERYFIPAGDSEAIWTVVEASEQAVA